MFWYYLNYLHLNIKTITGTEEQLLALWMAQKTLM